MSKSRKVLALTQGSQELVPYKTQETDIFNHKTPEFYINMQSIPDKGSDERKAFVLEEKRKCREGININGIFIPGSLYFHLNYFKLEGDNLETGRKQVMLPRLRDNEWILFNDYEEAFYKKQLYTFWGLRQFGKSIAEVSLCLRELSLFPNTQAIALFSNDPDKETFVNKIRTALQYGDSFIIIPNIDKDWSKTEIRFGFTESNNNVNIKSNLYIYNTQEGKKITISAGKTPSFVLLDEVGKTPFRKVFSQLEPALLSDLGGYRCAPVLCFTGGETDQAEDAKNLVLHPNAKKELTTTLNDGQIVGGRFFDGTFRKDCKDKTTLSEYLGVVTNTWIDEYPIYVSNKDKALKQIEEDIDEASKNPDPEVLNQVKIAFPKTVEDVFLVNSINKFPKAQAVKHQANLRENYNPQLVELERLSDNTVTFHQSDKKLIHKFPADKYMDLDAPCVMYEPPIKGLPYATYIVGIDQYNHDESNDLYPSLGSIYVWKRRYEVFGGAFQDQIVFSYSGRRKTLNEFYQLCENVIDLYGAIALPENEGGIIQYFVQKKKDHLLFDSPALTHYINSGSATISRQKGLAATTPNQRHYMDLEVEYTIERIAGEEGTDIQDNEWGITRIPDPMLLEEMIKYKGKTQGTQKGIHGINCDRIVAFGHALTLAKYLDRDYPVLGKVKQSDEPKVRAPKFISPFAITEHSSTRVITPFNLKR